MKSTRQYSWGLSLLEMLLVLAVIALLGQLSIGGWRQQQQMLHLDEVSRQLLDFSQQIQTLARWHNQSYQLKIQRSEQEGWRIAVFSSERMLGAHFVPAWPEVMLAEETASHGLQFHGRRGGASGGHLTLSNPAGQVRVILSAKGRLRRCSEGGELSGVASC